MNLTSKFFIVSILFSMGLFQAQSQCIDPANVYSFVYNNKTYEIIKENKRWASAANCAVERGGKLCEINDASEQIAVFNELSTNAGIDKTKTKSEDGGEAAYVWIGGTDKFSEGDWIWDGDNDGMGAQFWQGTTTGSPVGGLYNNWGNEPDNFGGQNGLGLALESWLRGMPGEWNDLSTSANTLYFVVEYAGMVGINDESNLFDVSIYPNPVQDFVVIETPNARLKDVTLINALGQEIKTVEFNNASSLQLDLSELEAGVYYLKINGLDDSSIVRKIIK